MVFYNLLVNTGIQETQCADLTPLGVKTLAPSLTLSAVSTPAPHCGAVCPTVPKSATLHPGALSCSYTYTTMAALCSAAQEQKASLLL